MIDALHDFLYIGDLSRNDADVLAHFARRAKAILEFGVGGSTHIFAQCAVVSCPITSLETSPAWIERTHDILAALGIQRPVELAPYERLTTLTGAFDLVFNDGQPEQRLFFAEQVWPRLQPDGWLLFHDTRRSEDWGNVTQILAKHPGEVRQVLFNIHESNITAIQKCTRLSYVNWNYHESRQPWETGNPDEARPADFKEQLARRQLV